MLSKTVALLIRNSSTSLDEQLMSFLLDCITSKVYFFSPRAVKSWKHFQMKIKAKILKNITMCPSSATETCFRCLRVQRAPSNSALPNVVAWNVMDSLLTLSLYCIVSIQLRLRSDPFSCQYIDYHWTMKAIHFTFLSVGRANTVHM
jgi:hypothetical protein